MLRTGIYIYICTYIVLLIYLILQILTFAVHTYVRMLCLYVSTVHACTNACIRIYVCIVLIRTFVH